MPPPFVLDPKIATDTLPVANLELSELRLMNDARYPWLLLVPRVAGAVEIIDLSEAEQQALMREIAAVARVLKAVSGCDKLNVAALGNIVRQLHVHLIARFAGDPAWPSAVWGVGAAVAYRPEEADRLAAKVRDALPR